MLLSKLKSSNLIFNDISLQPIGTGVLIFHSQHNRGALSCDEIKIHKDDKSITAIRDGKTIAVLSSDVSFIFIDRRLVSILSTEEHIDKTVSDGKEMEEFLKKYPDLNGQIDGDLQKSTAGHYL